MIEAIKIMALSTMKCLNVVRKIAKKKLMAFAGPNRQNATGANRRKFHRMLPKLNETTSGIAQPWAKKCGAGQNFRRVF